MAKIIPLCKADIGKEILEKCLGKNLNPSACVFNVNIAVGNDLYDKINDDATLAAKIFDATGAIFKKAKTDLSAIATKADADAGKGDRGKAAEKLTGDIATVMDEAKADMLKAFAAEVKKWQAVRGDHASYVMALEADVRVAAIGLAISTAGLVIGGVTAGASTILGIIGMAKTLVAIVKKVVEYFGQAEKAEDTLAGTLGKLGTSYQGQLKKSKEALADFIETWTSYEKVSIGRASKEFDNFADKVDRLDIATSDLGKGLNKLLDDMHELDAAYLKKWGANIDKAGMDRGGLDRLSAEYKTLADKVEKQIDTIIKQMDAVEKYHERKKVYATAIKELEDQKSSLFKALEITIKLSTISGGAAGLEAGVSGVVSFLTDLHGAVQEFGKEKTGEA